MKFCAIASIFIGSLSWTANAYPNRRECLHIEVGDRVMRNTVGQGNDIFAAFTADGVDLDCGTVITPPTNLLVRHNLFRSNQIIRLEGATFATPRNQACDNRQARDTENKPGTDGSNFDESDLTVDFNFGGEDLEITVYGAHASNTRNLVRSEDCTITISNTRQPTTSPVTSVPSLSTDSPTVSPTSTPAPTPAPTPVPRTGKEYDVKEGDFSADRTEFRAIYVETGDVIKFSSKNVDDAFYRFESLDQARNCPISQYVLGKEGDKYAYVADARDANGNNATYIAKVGKSYAATCQGDEISFLVLDFGERPPTEILIIFFAIVGGALAVGAILFSYTKLRKV